MKLNKENRDRVLARQLGYHCGLGEMVMFQFPSVDKAWNEYWPLIKDTAQGKGWILSSKDTLEREFRLGFFQAVEKKREAEQQ